MELNRVLIVDDDPAIRRVVSALLDLDEYGLPKRPTARPPWRWSGSSGPTWSSST
jgi:DNA-binding NtrC family response regulator